MSEQLLKDTVTGPQGTFEVSTIRTDAGGAEPTAAFGMPFFSSADFVDVTPWPFETMVFMPGSRKGLYHEPHATLKQAKDGHAYALSQIQAGLLTIGAGVQGPFGNPSITADEWNDRQQVKQ